MANTTEDIDTYRTEVRWGVRDVASAVGAIFAGVVAVLVGFRLVVNSFDGLDVDDVRPWGLAAVEGLMVLAVWVFAVRKYGVRWGIVGLRRPRVRRSFLLALAALAWVAGFAVFTAVHMPMLLRPRADGRAG